MLKHILDQLEGSGIRNFSRESNIDEAKGKQVIGMLIPLILKKVAKSIKSDDQLSLLTGRTVPPQTGFEDLNQLSQQSADEFGRGIVRKIFDQDNSKIQDFVCKDCGIDSNQFELMQAKVTTFVVNYLEKLAGHENRSLVSELGNFEKEMNTLSPDQNSVLDGLSEGNDVTTSHLGSFGTSVYESALRS